MDGGQLQQQYLHMFATDGIQGGEGLVQQQEIGLQGQCPGQAQALALASRQGVDAASSQAGQPHSGQPVLGGLAAQRARLAAQSQTEGEIVCGIEPWQQGMILKDHRAPTVGGGAGIAVNPDIATVRRLQSGQHMQQTGLAAA